MKMGMLSLFVKFANIKFCKNLFSFWFIELWTEMWRAVIRGTSQGCEYA